VACTLQKNFLLNFQKLYLKKLLIKKLNYDTILEISTKNLVYNLSIFRSFLKPKTKIMVMVKAYGYGLGPLGLSQFLEKNEVDYLGVANILEGVEIRKSGVQLPIMVMKPELKSFDLILKHQLSPVLFSIHSLLAYIKAIEEQNQTNQEFVVNLKIDTGMHRLGFHEEEIEKVIFLIKKHPNIKIESIFSHLAATDEPQHDDFTRTQIDLFEKLSTKITSQFTYQITRHLLNSNGIVRFPEAQYDMVRLGIGLFGFVTDKEIESQLKNTISLKTKIAQILTIKENETIGYGRNGITSRNTKIATVPLGYADGFSRKLGNGNWVMKINGKPAPTIGNVCMDMTMIDVSDINCNEDDVAVVFDTKEDILKMANQLDTIPYEVLTSISPRVKREFTED